MSEQKNTVKELGDSIHRIGVRLIKFNIVILIILSFNWAINLTNTDGDYNILGIFYYGFSLLPIANILVFSLSLYISSVLLEISTTITNIPTISGFKLKLTMESLNNIRIIISELLTIKDNVGIISFLINPLFIFSFLLSTFTSFLYFFIALIILVF